MTEDETREASASAPTGTHDIYNFDHPDGVASSPGRLRFRPVAAAPASIDRLNNLLTGVGNRRSKAAIGQCRKALQSGSRFCALPALVTQATERPDRP